MKAPELKEKLQESEKLIQEMTVTWEEKLRKTEEIATVRATVSKYTPRRICLMQHTLFIQGIQCHFVFVYRSVRSSWRAWASLWKHLALKWVKTSVSL